jgi:Fic family protein
LKYEQIHPFTNGNGRTGRLLMDKILIQNGFLPMIVFKDNKDAYFSAIQKAGENEV